MNDYTESLISRVIEREGGYVDHPADRGGPTKYGITQVALSTARGYPVTAWQVQALTEAEARTIYRLNYFEATGIDQVVDPKVQEFLFDFAVNSGVGAAVKALQRSIGVIDDGIFGPISRSALAAVTNWGMLFYRLKCERYELLLRFVGSDPAQAVFARGWANRLDEFEERVS